MEVEVQIRKGEGRNSIARTNHKNGRDSHFPEPVESAVDWGFYFLLYEGRMEGWMDGWMNGWMNGWMACS